MGEGTCATPLAPLQLFQMSLIPVSFCNLWPTCIWTLTAPLVNYLPIFSPSISFKVQTPWKCVQLLSFLPFGCLLNFFYCSNGKFQHMLNLNWFITVSAMEEAKYTYPFKVKAFWDPHTCCSEDLCKNVFGDVFSIFYSSLPILYPFFSRFTQEFSCIFNLLYNLPILGKKLRCHKLNINII